MTDWAYMSLVSHDCVLYPLLIQSEAVPSLSCPFWYKWKPGIRSMNCVGFRGIYLNSIQCEFLDRKKNTVTYL